MNHWQMIAMAYGLTFVALAVEIALLLRRRRAAWHQVQACGEPDGPDDAGEPRDARAGREAGEAA